MISYSQQHEDVLLNRVFGGITQGIYVDVGAHDPTYNSITRHFYDLGWSGINVEPLQAHYDALVVQRPRDLNIRAAATAVDGPVTLYDFSLPGLATLEPGVARDQFHHDKIAGGITVDGRALRTLLQPMQGKTIDFMSIDVEGHESQVIIGNDWRTYRPRVLVIEATHPCSTVETHQQWEHLLLAADYVFAFFDGLNRYYVRREDYPLLQRFSAPVNVFDGYVPVINIQFQQELGACRQRCQQLEAALEQLQGECESLRSQLGSRDS